jgi:bone morphogenetic protein 7
MILTFIYCVYASFSGIYVDNGQQTVLHHQLSGDETHEVEHEILELLGLPDRPRKRHIHPSLRYDFIISLRALKSHDSFCVA